MVGHKLTIDRELGARVRSARRERNLSEACLGALLGLSYEEIIRLESGEAHISSEQLTDIAMALDKTVVYFFQSWAVLSDITESERSFCNADSHERFDGGLRVTRIKTPRRGVGAADLESDRDLADQQAEYLQ